MKTLLSIVIVLQVALFFYISPFLKLYHSERKQIDIKMSLLEEETYQLKKTQNEAIAREIKVYNEINKLVVLLDNVLHPKLTGEFQ